MRIKKRSLKKFLLLILTVALVLQLFTVMASADTHFPDPMVAHTSEPNTQVTPGKYATAYTDGSPGYFTDIKVSWEIKSGDVVKVNFWDGNANKLSSTTMDTTQTSVRSRSINLPSGAYSAQIELSSGSALGNRYAWIKQATNNIGNTGYWPDPEIQSDPPPDDPPDDPPVEPDPEPPAAPSIYLSEKGRDYIKIAWGASEGATGYKIYRNGTHVDTVSGTNYTFTGLNPGTNYELKVKAYNNVGDSSFSNALNVSTDPIPSPENFRVLDRGWYHIKTAWDPVGDVDGYKIYRNGSYIGTTTSTNYEFSGLSEASLYNLGVAAYKGAYQSEIKQMQSSTQGVTQGDEIIQLLQSYLPDTCSQVKQIWQQVTKDLPVIATNINAITENTGSIKNDVKKLKDYITTPRIAPALQTDPIPPISFDSTLPDISEPGQDPYIYDRPDPVMPSPITSPGPLPFAPDPTIMPHDEPILSAPPTQLDEPVLREDPRQQDPVIKEPPLVRDPVTMDPPLAQDPVIKEPPLARDPASGMDPPLGREVPITADPPYTRTPPLTPAPPGG